jgi:hypothetical protein
VAASTSNSVSLSFAGATNMQSLSFVDELRVELGVVDGGSRLCVRQ